MQINDFLNERQRELILQAIKQAELKTSGELKIHVEAKCTEDPVERAKKVFVQLGMHKTELKNGVLFYLAFESRKFAVIGDEGIDNATPSNFWNEIKDKMSESFRLGNFAEGLINGIEQAGAALAEYFPRTNEDKNELSDEISFSE